MCLTYGVILYILYLIYYYIIHIILYLILYSSVLLFSSLLSLFFPFFLSFPPHSKYTCRYLDNLIYVPSQSDVLTPHVLSEWMVEVCRFDECVVFVLVYLREVFLFRAGVSVYDSGFRAGLTLGVCVIISYPILYSSLLPIFLFPSSLSLLISSLPFLLFLCPLIL